MAVKFRAGRGIASNDGDNFSGIAAVRAFLAGQRFGHHATEDAAPLSTLAAPSISHAAAQPAAAHIQAPAALNAAPLAATAADAVLFAVSNGGGASNSILRVGDDNGADVGNNLTRLFANNPAFHNLLDISLDVDHGFYFVVDSDYMSTNRILRGNIADLLSGTNTPSLTQVFATDGRDGGVGPVNEGEGIQNIEIDTVNQRVYWLDGDIFGDFEGGFQLNSAKYDGSDVQTVATIDTENHDPDYDFPGGVGDFAIDKVNGYAYVVASTGSVDGNGDTTVLQNDILRIRLSDGQTTFLNLGNSGVAAGYHQGRLDPATYGQISSVDVDQTTGQIYFTTQPLNQNDHGGVFKFVPGATAGDLTAGTLSTLWVQPADSAFTTPQSFPTSLITNIEFDEVTGRYFLTATYDSSENNASIFVGSAGGGAPSLFQQVTAPTATGAPLGMEIDYAATLTPTGANATYTEGDAAVSVLTSATLTDPDNDTLKGATVRISANFLAGDALSVTTTGTSISASYNSGTGVLTLTGSDTLAHYQSVLASLKYAASGDNPTVYDTATSRTISFTTFDGLVTSDAVTTTVNVAGVNDAPRNYVPAGFAVAEDAPLGTVFSNGNFNAISVSDVDANPASQALKTTLSVGHGTLTLSSLAGVTVTGNGSGSLTITGTANAINAALGAGLTYVSTLDYNGPDSLGVVTTDQGNTGGGGAQTDTDSVAISISAVVDIVGDSKALNEDTSTNIFVQGNDTFENPDHAISLGTGPAHGTVSINTNNTADTTDDYFVYTADADYFGSDSFTYVVTSGGTTETATVSVTVNAVNDAPTATATGASPTYVENAAAVTPFTGFAANAGPGEGAQTFTELKLTVTNVDSGHDALTFGASTLTLTNGATSTISGITATVALSGTNATVTFTSAAGVSAAVLNGLVNGMGYRYDGEDPSSADRVITITSLTDNGGGANGGVDTTTLSLTSTVHVTPVNDAPVNTVPGAQSVDEDGSLTITGISVADADAGNAPLTVTLSVAHGTLTLAGIAGLSFDDGDGSGDASMTFSGTQADIDTALAGLGYVPDADFSGNDTLSITTDDGGASGTGGAQSATDTVAITVNSVNDAPTLSATALDPTYTEDGAAVTLFSNIAASTGPANESGQLFTALTLTITNVQTGHDTLTLGGNALVLSDGASGSFSGATATVSITGTTATVTVSFSAGVSAATLESVFGSAAYSYTGDDPSSADRVVTITSLTDDGGNANGGDDTATLSLTSTVSLSAINDAPVNIVPPAITLREDASPARVFSTANTNALQISDGDADPASDPFSVTLSVGHGTLSLAGLAGVTIGGNGTDTVTLSGTINDINAALGAGLTYTATADYFGSDILNFTTSDGGASGAGGTQSDTDTIGITILSIGDIIGDHVTVGEDTSARLDLLANDTFENAARAITGVGAAAHGTVTINDNGTALDTSDDYVVYTADADYNGTDSFTYTVTSGGKTETASVSVRVTAATDIANDTLFVYEDSGSNRIDVLANDGFSDPNRAITAVGRAAHGIVRIDDNGTALDTSDDFVVYTANANYNGPDSFSYTVTAGGKTETANVRVQVRPVNDAPTGANGGATIARGSSYDLAVADFGFQDRDGDAFRSVYVSTVPTHGKLIYDNGVDPARTVRAGAIVTVDDIQHGYLSFVPDANAPGTVSFRFQVRDDGGVANGGSNMDATPNIFTLTLTTTFAAPHKLVSPVPHDDALTTAPGHTGHDAANNAHPAAHGDSAAHATAPAAATLPANFDAAGILTENRTDAPADGAASGAVPAIPAAAFADHVDARLLADSGLVAHAPMLHVLEVIA